MDPSTQNICESAASTVDLSPLSPVPPAQPKSRGSLLSGSSRPVRFSRKSVNSSPAERKMVWDHFFANLRGAKGDEAVLGQCASLAELVQKSGEELLRLCLRSKMDLMEVCRAMKSIFDPLRYDTQKGHLGHFKEGRMEKTLDPTEVYDFGTKLGAGSFGNVFRALHKPTTTDHAMKVVQKDKVKVDDLWKEVEILRQLDHPHLIRLYGVFEDKAYIYLALELCEFGGFHEKLLEMHCMPEPKASRIFKQILTAVSYMHGKSICHRDLKPDNFLVWQKGGKNLDEMHIKLNDFGTAKRFDLEPLMTAVCTVCYVAPEVLGNKGKKPYTEKVDSWSLGVMLFQILSGGLPFVNADLKTLLRLVYKGEVEFKPKQVWAILSDTSKSLIQQLMNKDPEARLRPIEATNHPWFTDDRMSDAIPDNTMLDRNVMQSVHRFVATGRLKRVALQIIAFLSTDESICRLRQLFILLDKDCSGTLTIDELWDAVTLMTGVSEMERTGMVQILCALDPTENDEIEYTDFLAATIPKEHYMLDNVCKAAFMRLDVDGDGVLSRKDLACLVADDCVLGSCGLQNASISERVAQLEAIFKEADTNRDGGICYEEFRQVMSAEDGLGQVNSALTKRRMRPTSDNAGLGARKNYYSKGTITDFADLAPSDVSEDEEEDEEAEKDKDFDEPKSKDSSAEQPTETAEDKDGALKGDAGDAAKLQQDAMKAAQV